ncbi:MAG: NTP transferase domain-containing protein, partial [Thermodesulfobacteriota bacterium]|nr:NTP transferase domain-containing protein [Thermodesulfobacteriota bacterium]
MMAHQATVILAAGMGKRMNSKIPKVLHSILGTPLIHFSVRLSQKIGANPTVVVVGHKGNMVKECLKHYDISFTCQKQQLGTGHAVMTAKKILSDYKGPLLILSGDVPLLKYDTLRALVKTHQKEACAITALTTEMENPEAYGRIKRGSGNTVEAIVEDIDASEKEKLIKEINTGIYCIESPLIFELLEKVDCNNAKQEYYLTDVVSVARKMDLHVCAHKVSSSNEVCGINTRTELANATEILRTEIIKGLMEQGVTF